MLMRKKMDVILRAAYIFAIICSLNTWALGASLKAVSDTVELASYEEEFSNAYIAPAKVDGQYGLVVVFEGTESLHYYASPKTAMSPDLVLKVQTESKNLEFGQAIFPEWKVIKDADGKNVDVYAGDFTVFIPMKTDLAKVDVSSENIIVKISGQTCTDSICLMPFEQEIDATIDMDGVQVWPQISLEIAQKDQTDKVDASGGYSVGVALTLAFLAGLILNIMPCVLPVIPLKVLSIFHQAKESKSRCIAMGLSFCLGILVFFAIIAGLNIILRIGYGTAFQWGDHFRYPAFIIGMAMLMVVLALFMFDVFAIVIPSSIGAKEGRGKGYSGSIGMGFLAALMGTPCSFAILTAAFAWAQTQNILLSTIAIMLIGLGMAAPYALLTSMPGLLKHLPKAGRWSELFKQSMGFVLFIVAMWLVLALPQGRQASVFYFAVILSFCVWMWGSWVTFSAPPGKKWTIRLIAIAIVTLAGAKLLPEHKELIDWQNYDLTVINNAVDQQQPVLIDFTADWCPNCKVVEKFVYGSKDIAELIEQKNVLVIKGDTTLKDSQATIDLENKYKVNGIPVNILLLPGENEPVYLPGIAIRQELKEHLESLPDKK